MNLAIAAALAWEVPLVGATAQMTMVSGYTAGLVLCRFTCSVPSPAANHGLHCRSHAVPDRVRGPAPARPFSRLASPWSAPASERADHPRRVGVQGGVLVVVHEVDAEVVGA